jgi:hypothetical protein
MEEPMTPKLEEKLRTLNSETSRGILEARELIEFTEKIADAARAANRHVIRLALPGLQITGERSRLFCER